MNEEKTNYTLFTIDFRPKEHQYENSTNTKVKKGKAQQKVRNPIIRVS